MKRSYLIILAAVVAVLTLSAQTDTKGGDGKVHRQWKHPPTTERESSRQNGNNWSMVVSSWTEFYPRQSTES